MLKATDALIDILADLQKGLKKMDGVGSPSSVNTTTSSTGSSAPSPASSTSSPATLGETATAGGTSTINSQIGSPFGKKEHVKIDKNGQWSLEKSFDDNNFIAGNDKYQIKKHSNGKFSLWKNDKHIVISSKNIDDIQREVTKIKNANSGAIRDASPDRSLHKDPMTPPPHPAAPSMGQIAQEVMKEWRKQYKEGKLDEEGRPVIREDSLMIKPSQVKTSNPTKSAQQPRQEQAAARSSQAPQAPQVQESEFSGPVAAALAAQQKKQIAAEQATAQPNVDLSKPPLNAPSAIAKHWDKFSDQQKLTAIKNLKRR